MPKKWGPSILFAKKLGAGNIICQKVVGRLYFLPKSGGPAILFAKKWWARYIFWAQTLKVLDKDDKRKSFDVQMESSPVEEQMWDALKSLSQQEA